MVAEAEESWVNNHKNDDDDDETASGDLLLGYLATCHATPEKKSRQLAHLPLALHR